MTDWRRAACKGYDPELWFPEGYDKTRNRLYEKAARELCAGCPIKLACLQLALDNEEGIPGRYRSGIFGGLNGVERKKLDATTARNWALADHGTTAAYRRHMRRKERPCEPCRIAQSEHETKRRGERRRAALHGSYAGYTKGCRCEPCKEAQNQYHRDYRRNQRAQAC